MCIIKTLQPINIYKASSFKGKIWTSEKVKENLRKKNKA